MCASKVIKLSVCNTVTFKFMEALINNRGRMVSFTQQWQCINKCPTFETISTPAFCPHCASKELYPLRDEDMKYDKKNVVFSNDDSIS